MKTVVIVFEAAADEPVRELDGQTPLELARLHLAGRWARAGSCGVVESLPEPPFWRPEAMLAMFAGLPADRALSWRRGPVEALTAHESLPKRASVVYRADFVTMDEGMVRDAGPARLGEEETEALVSAVAACWEAAGWALRTTGPGTAVAGALAHEDPLWEGVSPQWVEGVDAVEVQSALRMPERFRAMLAEAAEVLSGHPVNDVRVDLRENPANGLWLWGGGRRMERVRDIEPPAGIMLTNSLLGRGVAAACGMRILPLRSPYDYDDDRLPFSVPEVVTGLRETRLLMVHVSAPHRGGRYGSARDKIRALDHLDQRLLSPLAEVLEAYRPYRLILATDGVGSTESGRLREGVAPLVWFGDGIPADDVERWNEVACARGGLGSMKLRDFWDRMAAAEVATG